MWNLPLYMRSLHWIEQITATFAYVISSNMMLKSNSRPAKASDFISKFLFSSYFINRGSKNRPLWLWPRRHPRQGWKQVRHWRAIRRRPRTRRGMDQGQPWAETVRPCHRDNDGEPLCPGLLQCRAQRPRLVPDQIGQQPRHGQLFGQGYSLG